MLRNELIGQVRGSSLFPAELVVDVPVVNVDKRSRIKQIAHFAYQKLQESQEDRVILRALDDHSDKCITCVERIKDEAAVKTSKSGVLHQWTKIGELRVGAENKLDLDSYIPVLEIMISRTPFDQKYANESIQEFKFDEGVRQKLSGVFDPPKLDKLDSIGRENPNNIFRRKRRK